MAGREEAGPILNGMPSQLPDIDPDETAEWLESLDGIVDERGRSRARYVMLSLLQRARERQVGVPSLSFTTGAHVDYHKPSDTADKIVYDDLDRIASFGATLVERLLALDQPLAFAKVEQSNQTAGRTGVRVFTGTIPDYASTAKGLLLGGVVGGGPAEQAGLAKGDVLIEIAGQSITNIYDYTYALELLKIDVPVKVVYLRDGQRRETTLTPSARR